MVCLGIAMLLLGVGMYAGKFWSEEQAFSKPMDEIKIMAKTAQHRAIAEQRDWEIILRPRSIELRAKQAVSQEDQNFLQAVDANEKRGSGTQTYKFAEDIEVYVKRFGEDKWHSPRPDHWVFQHSGICEPLQFRVVRGAREAVVMFDPLTAGTRHIDVD